MSLNDFDLALARSAAEAARGAREIIVGRRGAADVAEKGAHDFVTAADKAVQKLLFTELAEKYPDFALFGEEGEHRHIDPAVPTWVIDPIDGTTNFVRRLDASVVSVALVYEGESRIGVVYDPFTDRAFVSARGEGAFCGDARLHVSDVDYSEAVVGVGTMPYDKSDSERLFRMWHRIFLETNDLRRAGTAASDIVRTAEGKLDGYIEKGSDRGILPRHLSYSPRQAAFLPTGTVSGWSSTNQSALSWPPLRVLRNVFSNVYPKNILLTDLQPKGPDDHEKDQNTVNQNTCAVYRGAYAPSHACGVQEGGRRHD